MLAWGKYVGMPLDPWPTLVAYNARIKERPTVKAAMAAAAGTAGPGGASGSLAPGGPSGSAGPGGAAGCIPGVGCATIPVG